MDRIIAQALAYPGAHGAPMPATLYRPEGDGPFPAVVELAGGGWVSGDRFNNEGVNRALAQLGVMVLAVDVSKPPAAGYPQAIADVNAAVRWFKANAERLGARPERIGGLGSSSGGHQMMLNALRYADPLYAGDADADGPDASLAFIAVCWPVLDPLGRYHMAKGAGMAQLVANHDAYWGGEAQMAEGSPQAIVADGRAQALPPMLLVQGGRDDNVPLAMSLAFAQAYCDAGARIDLALFPGQPHSFIRKDPASKASRAAVAALAAFILDL